MEYLIGTTDRGKMSTLFDLECLQFTERVSLSITQNTSVPKPRFRDFVTRLKTYTWKYSVALFVPNGT